MFELIYAKSIRKDLKNIFAYIETNKKFYRRIKKIPDISNLKSLNNHQIADYRLRVRDYRILFYVILNKRSNNVKA